MERLVRREVLPCISKSREIPRDLVSSKASPPCLTHNCRPSQSRQDLCPQALTRPPAWKQGGDEFSEQGSRRVGLAT